MTDPLKEAEVFLQFGRKRQALALLKAALRDHPERADIRDRLHALESGPQTSSGKRPWVFHHLLMAQLLYMTSLVAVFAVVLVLPVGLAAYLSPEFSASLVGHPDDKEFLVMMVGLLVGIVASVFLWIRLFVRLWFSYLKLLPNEVRSLVLQKLPQEMRVQAFEPHYSEMRHRLFGDDA